MYCSVIKIGLFAMLFALSSLNASAQSLQNRKSAVKAEKIESEQCQDMGEDWMHRRNLCRVDKEMCRQCISGGVDIMLFCNKEHLSHRECREILASECRYNPDQSLEPSNEFRDLINQECDRLTESQDHYIF